MLKFGVAAWLKIHKILSILTILAIIVLTVDVFHFILVSAYCQIKSHPSAAKASCFNTLFPMILISEALFAESPLRFLGLIASTPYSGKVP